MKAGARSHLRKVLLLAMARETLQPLWEKMERLLCMATGIGTGADPKWSGERRVAQSVVPEHGLVLDVGANVGQYASMLLAVKPNVHLHCFEPSSICADLLQSLLPSGVQVHQVGLSSSSGQKQLYGEAGSGLASLHQRRLEHFGIVISDSLLVSVVTLDEFCLQHGIDRIDFLKIDVEGHELEVLRGASSLLDRGAVHAIQFEFGGANIDSRTYFQDLWYLLSEDFRISRILANGLRPISKYEESLERFVTTNYLAVLRSPHVQPRTASNYEEPSRG